MIQQLARTRRWRGNDRGYLRKLQKALKMMENREARMDLFVGATGSQGNFFDNTTDNSITNAMTLLQNRIQAALVELTP